MSSNKQTSDKINDIAVNVLSILADGFAKSFVDHINTPPVQNNEHEEKLNITRSCSVCTFENTLNVQKCQMCGSLLNNRKRTNNVTMSVSEVSNEYSNLKLYETKSIEEIEAEKLIRESEKLEKLKNALELKKEKVIQRRLDQIKRNKRLEKEKELIESLTQERLHEEQKLALEKEEEEDRILMENLKRRKALRQSLLE